MKTGSAITIVRSSNGFIVFEQDRAVLPDIPSEIATFAELDGGYSHETRTLIPFIKKHFKEQTTNTDDFSSTDFEVPGKVGEI